MKTNILPKARAICRGLNFAIPRPVSAKDIQAYFESACRTLEHNVDEDKKELTVATLPSIALNYILNGEIHHRQRRCFDR
jgi:hypothetical protein